MLLLFRKVGVAVVTTTCLLTPTVFRLPAGATPSVTVLPAPGPDRDGDGFETTEVEVQLDLEGTVVDFDGTPDSLFLDDVSAGVVVRSRLLVDGSWTPWTESTAGADEAPDEADPVAGIGPIWVRGAASVELALAPTTAPTDASWGVIDGRQPDGTPQEAVRVTVGGIHAVEPDTPASYGAETGAEDPTATTTTTTTTPSEQPSDTVTAPVEADGTFIRPRSAWATADMDWACTSGPDDVGALDAAVVHHTAGRNDYTAAEVPAIIRSIWQYHVGTRGWCDVAYNFVVDRFGRVWEARQGGIALAIRGGHTRGFNTGTTGIAQLGDFSATATPAALTQATGRILGWKLGVHGLDPQATRTVVNRSGETVQGVPDDGEMQIPTIVGHRDLGSTECPGENTYATLDELIRRATTGVRVAALQQAFLGSADPGHFGPWIALAESDGVGAAARDMAFSDEYAGVIVDDLYQRVLGRPAEPAGRAYWLAELAGGMRVEQVGAIFYGSKEYVDAAGSTRNWVDALYENLLHRAPEDEGLAYWVSMLEGGSLTAPEIARGFYLSVESRLDRVAGLYDRFLGRPPDRAGQVYWAEQLIDTDDVLLAVHLSLSDEFYERATS